MMLMMLLLLMMMMMLLLMMLIMYLSYLLHFQLSFLVIEMHCLEIGYPGIVGTAYVSFALTTGPKLRPFCVAGSSPQHDLPSTTCRHTPFYCDGQHKPHGNKAYTWRTAAPALFSYGRFRRCEGCISRSATRDRTFSTVPANRAATTAFRSCA